MRLIRENRAVNTLIALKKNRLSIGSNCSIKYSPFAFRHNNIECTGDANNLSFKEAVQVSSNKIICNGNNNKIVVDSGSCAQIFCNNTVRITGDNNRIIIEEGTRFTDSSLFISGNNNSIYIKNNCSFMLSAIHIEQDCNSVMIGSGCTFHGRSNAPVELLLDEGTSITIDEDCMISNAVQFRSSDSHSILDMEGHRINPGKNIIIGKHVWICFRAILLKGTIIPDNCVISAGAICTKQFSTSNCIYAGNPASIVKTDIKWDRKFVDNYEMLTRKYIEL